MAEHKILKKAVIREEFVAITGHYIEALILNQFIYWSRRTKDHDQFLSEENKRRMKNGLEQVHLTHGWIYKTAKDLSEEIMIGVSRTTIGRYIKKLVSKRFLEIRKNPDFKYDQTLQYRVNLIAVEKALSDHGYVLEGYKKAGKVHGYRNPKMRHGDFTLRDGNVKNENCNNTEITTKNTTAATTENMLSSVYYKSLNLKFDSEAIRDVVGRWLPKTNSDYVKEAIAFANATTNATDSFQYKSYLSQTLKGGWAKGYKVSVCSDTQNPPPDFSQIKGLKVNGDIYPIQDRVVYDEKNRVVFWEGKIIEMISKGEAYPVYDLETP